MARDMVQVRRPPTNQFAVEPNVGIRRSQFNLSRGRKMTFDASYIYPIFVQEILPGDTFTCRMTGFARIFSPLDAPVMDNIELETFFFFVPNRLVWENWHYFMGEHDQAGAQDTSYTVPVLASGWTIDHDNAVDGDGLGAYMGLPHGLQSGQVSVSALPFRAYSLIMREWFRDQNVDSAVTVLTGNSADTVGYYAVRKSHKKHDYFTSCLPYLQKGDAQTVSLSGQVDVRMGGTTGDNLAVYSDTLGDHYEIDSDGPRADLSLTVSASGDDELYVDLSDAGVLDINDLRQSVAIQRLLEKDARGGTRYTEKIKAHFGVTSPDYRLQRPEFLGGGKSYINISPVANTSATASEDQGELRGIGTGSLNGHNWAKSFTEHGYVLGLIRARGDLTYFQGLDRHWSRSSLYDFYFPALANLGEQAVLNKEIYVSNSSATDDAVFGYQERWAEYRYAKSEVIGVFNPDVSGALSHWHLAEDFASLPSLNTTFMNDQTPMSRVTTVDTEPDFLLDAWFDVRAARPLPVHSIPSLMARF